MWLAAARSKFRIARVMWLAFVTTTIFSIPCGCSSVTVRNAFSRVSREDVSSQRSGRPKVALGDAGRDVAFGCAGLGAVADTPAEG